MIKPYQLAYVSPKEDCVLLEENARFMTKAQMQRLTDNVKQDGFLSQIPFGIKKDGEFRFTIISGNHRIKSAIKAELENVLILYLDEKEVSEQKALAIQLSHNAITGQDDMAVLLGLYKKITDLGLKEYTGLDEAELGKYDKFDLSSINEDDFELIETRFMFSKLNMAKVDKTIEKLENRLFAEKNDRVVFANFYKFVDVMTEIKLKTGIKNNTVAFLKMMEICEEYLEKEKEAETA